MATIREVADQSIGDVDQIPIRDHHRQSEEETDHDRLFREESDRGHPLGEEIASKEVEDQDQLHRRNAEEEGRIEIATMFERSGETRPQSIPDLLLQTDDEGHLIAEVRILQIRRIGITEAMAPMGGIMITVEIAVDMTEKMIVGLSNGHGMTMLKRKRPNGNGNWLQCNKMPRNWMSIEKSV